MSIRGLNIVFKNSVKILKDRGFIKGTKNIFQHVQRQGGTTASIFCGVGFGLGCVAPAAVIAAPVLGYTGAIAGKILSNGAKCSYRLAKHMLKILI